MRRIGGKKFKSRLSRESEKGQSTIEFTLTLILLLAFVFFYFQLAMILAYGHFAHYATFMAARALLSSGADVSDQQTRSRTVIVRMLKKSEGAAGIDKFPTIARGYGGDGQVSGMSNQPPGQFQPHTRDFSWMQGVRYTFKSKLFIIPLAGLGSSGGGDLSPQVNTLTLTSESWLGREPTYDECQNYLKRYSGLFDNGC